MTPDVAVVIPLNNPLGPADDTVYRGIAPPKSKVQDGLPVLTELWHSRITHDLTVLTEL
jgi:hypothetical protein